MIYASTIQRKMSDAYINTYSDNLVQLFIIHIENIVPPVMFIDKFNVVLFFKNIKNVDNNILECEIHLTFLLLSLLQITLSHTFEGTDNSAKTGKLDLKKELRFIRVRLFRCLNLWSK